MTEVKTKFGRVGIFKCHHTLGRMVTIGNVKNANKFVCEKCDFECFKLSNYNKHITTAKHKMVTDGDKKMPNTNTKHICSCGKEFKYRQGLSRHKKSCNGVAVTTPAPVANTNNDLINVIVKQQEETTELKKLLIEQQETHFKQMKEQQEQMKEQQEQMKEQQSQHSKEMKDLIPQLQQVTNINTNCNNKFNLNFFLNEQCKDAISIQNFIENLNIGIRELEHMGDVGYVKGMMSIFSETLGAMDIYKRPLHCTDLKRDTLYIKQGDTWTKDTEDKTELKKIVETVKCRNYGSLRLWEREHPEAFECDTQDNIDYMRISSESLGGFNSTDTIKLNKIIKHVVKEVYVK